MSLSASLVLELRTHTSNDNQLSYVGANLDSQACTARTWCGATSPEQYVIFYSVLYTRVS